MTFVFLSKCLFVILINAKIYENKCAKNGKNTTSFISFVHLCAAKFIDCVRSRDIYTSTFFLSHYPWTLTQKTQVVFLRICPLIKTKRWENLLDWINRCTSKNKNKLIVRLRSLRFFSVFVVAQLMICIKNIGNWITTFKLRYIVFREIRIVFKVYMYGVKIRKYNYTTNCWLFLSKRRLKKIGSLMLNLEKTGNEQLNLNEWKQYYKLSLGRW